VCRNKSAVLQVREMSNFNEHFTRITATLHEYVFTFIKISHLVMLSIRNVSDKSCRKN
jgi:hypothetical protein